jgi:uncharacterized protein with FMN-binding domain
VKRVIVALVGTVGGLVMLLSFKTNPPSDTSAGDESAAPLPSTGPAKSSHVITGDAIDTRWGPVQVQLTMANGRIIKARAIKVPHDRDRSVEISSFAVPQLTQETVAAQSARIDAVSGASYTSEGYIRSLQSALDRAGR